MGSRSVVGRRRINMLEVGAIVIYTFIQIKNNNNRNKDHTDASSFALLLLNHCRESLVMCDSNQRSTSSLLWSLFYKYSSLAIGLDKPDFLGYDNFV